MKQMTRQWLAWQLQWVKQKSDSGRAQLRYHRDVTSLWQTNWVDNLHGDRCHCQVIAIEKAGQADKMVSEHTTHRTPVVVSDIHY